MQTKFLGYLLTGLGLIGLALNSTLGRTYFPIINEVNKISVLVGSLAFVIAGIIIMAILGRTRQSKKEVPIYEGKGKGRKIVAYQREK